MNETVAGTAVVNLALNDAHLPQGQLLGIGSFLSLPERASARPYADAGYASGVWRQAVREALADVSRIGGGDGYWTHQERAKNICYRNL